MHHRSALGHLINKQPKATSVTRSGIVFALSEWRVKRTFKSETAQHQIHVRTETRHNIRIPSRDTAQHSLTALSKSSVEEKPTLESTKRQLNYSMWGKIRNHPANSRRGTGTYPRHRVRGLAPPPPAGRGLERGPGFAAAGSTAAAAVAAAVVEQVIPFHSDLPKEEVMLAFGPVGEGVVKVVVATNSAESSITLPDVDNVICLGSCKEVWHDSGFVCEVDEVGLAVFPNAFFLVGGRRRFPG